MDMLEALSFKTAHCLFFCLAECAVAVEMGQKSEMGVVCLVIGCVGFFLSFLLFPLLFQSENGTRSERQRSGKKCVKQKNRKM